MFNSEKPSLEELPSSRQLIRSTIIAFVGAVLILVGVVLPAEYGIDPIGAGRALGLTEMGEIKSELREEAERDHQNSQSNAGWKDHLASLFGLVVGSAHAAESGDWKDREVFTLEPGGTHELKLTMKKGAQASYRMIVEGGRVNYDLHAHAGGKAVTYEKGRGSSGSEGELVAAFDGNHGWFWRNRDSEAATVTLLLKGDYSAIKR